MKPIGGFYELLLPASSFAYHQEAIALSNGRACIRVVINNLSMRKCYLPNYTCDAVYDPFIVEGVAYELYNINEKFAPVSLPELGADEYFYYINYYGVMGSMIDELYKKYGDKLIIDNTHDFFRKRQYSCWSFTSARKYFGVPDGAFLYTPIAIDTGFERFNNFSLTHSVERLKGNQSAAFKRYQEYEEGLDSTIARISLLSERMLSLVSIDEVIRKRRENFRVLHELLGGMNQFSFSHKSDDDVPFAYPFLPAQPVQKDRLYRDSIFIPTLWADPLSRQQTSSTERDLIECLLPLPIDDRYDADDMKYLASKLLEQLDGRA